jgi:hypothetical protein
LPLVGGQGQKLDDQSAVCKVVKRCTGSNYHLITLDLSETYSEPVKRFYRTIVLVDGYGLIVVDDISLSEEQELNWRLHSPLKATFKDEQSTVVLGRSSTDAYKCRLVSHADVQATLMHGYEGELTIPDRSIESDASQDVVHLDWQLAAQREHQILGCCVRDGLELPEIRWLKKGHAADTSIELQLYEIVIFISY